MTDMITDHVKLPGGVTAVLERPGARLVFEVSGDGPAVVLIHGFGLDMRMWDPQIAPLAAMVAGYPGQHWLGQDPHRETRRPIDVLEGIAVPALVAVGERDVPGFREMSAVLARRIPGAAYHVVADAGHMVTMEQPAAVNDLLTGFLREASWSR